MVIPEIDPYVDSCAWLTSDVKSVQLSPGKILSGVVIPMQRGVRFVVRVNDPGKLLPIPIGKNNGNQLVVTIAAPTGYIEISH